MRGGISHIRGITLANAYMLCAYDGVLRDLLLIIPMHRKAVRIQILRGWTQQNAVSEINLFHGDLD